MSSKARTAMGDTLFLSAHLRARVMAYLLTAYIYITEKVDMSFV